MSYPNKNRSWIFFSILFLAVSLVLIFGIQLNAACGGSKTCKHAEGGKSCPMHSKTTSATGAQEATTGVSQAPSLGDFSKENLYTCPMHPEVREKKSGNCPKCGMKLEKEEFYKVYFCGNKECPHVSAKKMKCCGKDLQMKVMSKNEYYALAGLQEEYFCPMHSDVTSSQPGKCPKCGMNLESRTVSKPSEKAEEKP
jgi:hypothetical protein